MNVMKNNKSTDLYTIYCVPGTPPSIFHIPTPFVLTTPP